MDEISKIEDGEIFPKERLLVFGKNLDTVLGKKVFGWAELLKSLRESFKLPAEKSKPGPRDVQALGLV